MSWPKFQLLAIQQVRKTLEIDPQFPRPYLLLGKVYLQASKFDEAILELEKAKKFSGESPFSFGALGYGCALAGKRQEALKNIEQLKDLSKKRFVAPTYVAGIYLGLGELDPTFEWLEKAYEERDAFLEMITEPMWDPIRSDPRYTDLMRRMKRI